ncbi:hypothetical protein MGYG_01730 [Nannizzia gypsea CBS 118893]|uniref:SAP domain-containing protein n=1 Tax=Arthroderma gypseum (strain ATCC MYA-4604 / CBS 118893) TaxID=535722 RepID=E5R308_ARTGP|nr:hypothetical protein MGYG_01730 [Nannizzia gypsea CBS 118893]EFQ98712.1 hypothetical protein MGYG_01730 [Nannizzia gypsea CBS 118893]
MPSIVTKLQTLKVRQLQKLALSIGILSSGAKKDLINRLTETFQTYDRHGRGQSDLTARHESAKAKLQEQRNPALMSILSIDMGIRNLAYAHILVSSRFETDTSLEGTTQPISQPLSTAKISLNAWDRLAISSFPSHEIQRDPSAMPISKLGGLGKVVSQSSSYLQEGEEQTERDPKEHFAPYLYASHAYTLITSLLEAYKPTHILIERQRFRSGGSSAVLEWTIRVGVFEGMLYAVLHTLRQQGKGGLARPFVQGVDPQRVVRYWTNDEKKEDIAADSKKRVSSKEGKKAKIDLVGRCLSRSVGVDLDIASKAEIPLELGLIDGSQARDIVQAYLNKWNGGSRTSKKGAVRVSTEQNNERIENIGKLDDLADSLLQGITWLEWQKMTEKLLYSNAAIPI